MHHQPLKMAPDDYRSIYADEVQQWNSGLKSMLQESVQLKNELALMVTTDSCKDWQWAEAFLDRCISVELMVQYLLEELQKQFLFLARSDVRQSAFIEFVREQQLLRVHVNQAEALFGFLQAEFSDFKSGIGLRATTQL